jgi:hypothetical protein
MAFTENETPEAVVKALRQFHVTFYSSCLRMKGSAHARTICEWANWINVSPRSNTYNFFFTIAVYLMRHVISIRPPARPFPLCLPKARYTSRLPPHNCKRDRTSKLFLFDKRLPQESGRTIRFGHVCVTLFEHRNCES